MSVNPSEPIIICVNSGSSFKRHEQHTGGQLWMQADLKMTAMNIPFPGTTNDSESACLAGVAEAVEWAHVLEDGLPKRPTQRVVIYPPTMTEFSRVLAGDTSNIAEGHQIACPRISNASFKYEAPPAFYSADSQDFGGIDPAKVRLWMHTAAQVSIGGRSTVLEDGADVCNSESDSDKEDHGEALKGMYSEDVPRDSNGNPILGKCRLSPTQAEILRLAALLNSRPPSDYSSATESSCSEGEDSVDEFYRCNPQVPKFSKLVAIRNPTEEEKALIAQMVKDSRERLGKEHVIPPKSTPRRATRSTHEPEESVHPMTTRSKSEKASGAGGLRPAVGSGQKDTRVARGNPSKT
jgi:hypothetical protein